MANLTLLPRHADAPADIVCGDVGPANLPLDALARARLGVEFDAQGLAASRGEVCSVARDRLLNATWVDQPPPRSFGREEFGAGWVQRLEALMPQATTEDLLATVVAVEVEALRRFIEAFAPAADGGWVCYLTGGGRHHRGWIEQARAAMPQIEFRGIEDLGVDPDAKEAVDFAYLGGQTLRRLSAGQSSLTGADRDLVLGTVHDTGVGQ